MPAQTTPKEAIAEALQSLDHVNDALWTDDGAPLVAEVQRLCNDKTVTRGQINDALPGFVRKTKESVAEDAETVEDAETAEVDTGFDPITGMPKEVQTAPAEATDEFNDPIEAADAALSKEDEYQRLRAIAQRRVDDAQDAISEAKNKVSAAIREVTNAENRHTRALQLFSSKYPPLSTAENIKQHLARQQEILRERMTGSRFEPNVAQNPVDATLMNRKRDNGRNNTAGAKFLPLSAGG